MKLPPPLHNWQVTPKEAIAIQNELTPKLRDEPHDLAQIKTVAGIDVSVKDGISTGAVVILDFHTLEVLEAVHHARPTDFPYVPGLLTFREGAVLLDTFAKLTIEPDVLIFDGMGRIHPRRMGIASHLGIWLNKPSLGVGKTHFIGTYNEPAKEKGASSPLMYKGDQLGVVLRTRTNVKPVYISAGHRMTLENAVDIVMKVTPKYRQPEPIRQAHNYAGQTHE